MCSVKIELKFSLLVGVVYVFGEENISLVDIWLYCIIIYVFYIFSLF